MIYFQLLESLLILLLDFAVPDPIQHELNDRFLPRVLAFFHQRNFHEHRVLNIDGLHYRIELQ